MFSPDKTEIFTVDFHEVRLLKPLEFEAIRAAATYEGGRIDLDVCLYTGMRYVELQRLHQNPDWLMTSRGYIHLPKGSMLKLKAEMRERYVRLNPRGTKAALDFIEKQRNLPTGQGFAQNLKRWAKKAKISPAYLCAKTFRKTWECWLTYSYPQNATQILASMGHTQATALGHYLAMPFIEEEKIAMKPYVEGWLL